MEEQMRQQIVQALEVAFDMSAEEAEQRVFDSQAIDGVIGVEMMKNLFGEEEVEFEAVGLIQDGHEYSVNVSWFASTPERYLISVCFSDKPIVDNVKEAFAKYEEDELSKMLQIEQDVNSEEDALVLVHDFKGDELSVGLGMTFMALRLAPVKQLLDTVLSFED